MSAQDSIPHTAADAWTKYIQTFEKSDISLSILRARGLSYGMIVAILEQAMASGIPVHIIQPQAD